MTAPRDPHKLDDRYRMSEGDDDWRLDAATQEDGEPAPMPLWAIVALVVITVGIGAGVAWVLS